MHRPIRQAAVVQYARRLRIDGVAYVARIGLAGLSNHVANAIRIVGVVTEADHPCVGRALGSIEEIVAAAVDGAKLNGKAARRRNDCDCAAPAHSSATRLTVPSQAAE